MEAGVLEVLENLAITIENSENEDWKWKDTDTDWKFGNTAFFDLVKRSSFDLYDGRDVIGGLCVEKSVKRY